MLFNPLSTLLPLSLLGSIASPIAALSLPTINTTTLTPWLIPRLSTHSPSSYPASHPYSRLTFTITDPNTITLGTTNFGPAAFDPSSANCTVWWQSHTENPLGGQWENTCEDVEPRQGRWSFKVTNGVGEGGGSATSDFGLRVRVEEAVVLKTGGVVEVVFEGEAAFRVGGNMGGSCGGSGVCNWGLKAESVPVVVEQRLVGVRCVAGTCEAGE